MSRRHSITRRRAQRGLFIGRALLFVCALSLAGMSASASALSQRGHVFSSTFGSSGEGQLHNPAGVAVNEETGEVYVVDRGDNRINVYSSAGTFLETWGWGVLDGKKEYEICKAGEGCHDGTPDPGKGAEEITLQKGELRSPEGIAVDNAADENHGEVYVVAAVAPERTYVYRFGAGGAYLGHLTTKKESEEYGRPEGVAVDGKGVVWVAWSEGQFTALKGGEKHEVLSSFEAEVEAEPLRPGFAVDAEDNLYVDFEPAELFSPETEGLAGEEGRGEGGVEPCEKAHCFVSKLTSSANAERQLEPGERLIGGFEAGETTGLTVNLFNNDVYVDRGTTVTALTSEGEPIETLGEGVLSKGSGVGVNSATETVYVVDASKPGVDVFAPEPPAGPSIDERSVTSITATTATLNALVDPSDTLTSATFKYGVAACSGGECTSVASEATLGEVFGDVPTTAKLVGLQPNTSYHYLLSATNAHGTVTSEEGTFTTRPAVVSHELADSRSWEMVSPAEKDGAGYESISLEGGIIQAAESGDALSYISTGPDGSNVEGNRSPTFTQNLARRVSGAGGAPEWTSQDIATPNSNPQGVAPGHEQEYELFSSELSQSIVEPFGLTANSEPALSPETTEKTIYRRNSDECAPAPSSCYLPLVDPADDTAGTKFGGVSAGASGIRFITATPDLKHVLLSAEVPLTTEPAAAGKNYYEWTEGEGGKAGSLQLVNVLPEGEGHPAAEAGIGALYESTAAPSFLIRNAISSDGSRVVWSAGHHLYMRDMSTRTTVQIDTPEAGVSAGGQEEPTFQTASSDGSEVFFTDERALTTESTASGEREDADLYGFNVNSGKLTDLTIDLNRGETPEGAAVRGLVIGTSKDGATVYFVANGVLTRTANARGETAQPGSCPQHDGEFPPPDATCNLYVEHLNTNTEEWETPELVAELSKEDLPNWIDEKENLEYDTAAVSSNGRFLAFMSQQSLTGYDNRDANPAAHGAHDQEVFLFDAQHPANLICASCDPTGARPNGVFDTEDSGEGLGLLVDRIKTWSGHWLAGSLPGWTSAEGENAIYQSRYLSESGRLFFNSPVSLVPADENVKNDVYEYEPIGTGSCQSEPGCVSLLSSGSSQKESAFLDASVSGNDMFFLTASVLAPIDQGTEFDVYDARSCTESPCVEYPTGSLAPCGSEAQCKAPPATQPALTPPAAVATGSGNVTTQTQVVVHPVNPKRAAPTRKQLLAKALKACKRDKSKHKRVACERKAKKKYGAKKAHKARRASAATTTGSRR